MHIEIKCNNLAVHQILQEGKARDPMLVTIARNIWMLTSLFNVHMSVTHIAGKQNVIADLLPRWWAIANNSKKLTKLLPQWTWVRTRIDLTKLNHCMSLLCIYFR